jgi:hypothetical protein
MVVIADKHDLSIFCVNCTLEGTLNNDIVMENNPDFIDDITGKKGAIRYESGNESYTLEREVMKRLICCALEPEEYFALAKLHGSDKFLLHSDFYDDIDGEALQPLI